MFLFLRSVVPIVIGKARADLPGKNRVKIFQGIVVRGVAAAIIRCPFTVSGFGIFPGVSSRCDKPFFLGHFPRTPRKNCIVLYTGRALEINTSLDATVKTSTIFNAFCYFWLACYLRVRKATLLAEREVIVAVSSL